MLVLSLIVVACGVVAWFIHRVLKTDKDIVAQRQQREIAFLAQHLPRSASTSQNPSHD